MSRLLVVCRAFVVIFLGVILNAPGISLPGAFFISDSYAADAKYPFLGMVTRGPVNVRAGANTNFESLDKLEQGVRVVVLAKNFEWYKIQLPATAAVYVRADYVQVLERKTGALTGNRVNLRAKPNSTSSTIGQLTKGEMIKLLDKVNEWWKIEPPAAAVGWIHQDFLKMEAPHVPADMLRQRVITNVGVVTPTPVAPPAAGTPVPVNVRGKVQARVLPTADAHYQVSVDGKVVYYLHDTPHLSRFKDVMVNLDGTVTHSSQDLPLLRVQKISLLL